MKITLIVACDENGAIGKNNTLPWRIPSELKHFKKYTDGKIVVCGRKTFESLPFLLKNRNMFVLSKNEKTLDLMQERADLFKEKNQQDPPFCALVKSMSQFIETYDGWFADTHEEICIIGGAFIYELFYPYADKVVYTLVHTSIDGADAFFEKPNKAIWSITNTLATQVQEEGDEFPYSIYEITKNKSAEIISMKTRKVLTDVEIMKLRM